MALRLAQERERVPCTMTHGGPLHGVLEGAAQPVTVKAWGAERKEEEAKAGSPPP